VSPGFFRTLGTRLIAGRDFHRRDSVDAPRVAIVNQTFARQILNSEDAVGQRFLFDPGGNPVLVIGVVEFGKYVTLTESPRAVLFRPMAQIGTRTRCSPRGRTARLPRSCRR
jgi:hypothetical protein